MPPCSRSRASLWQRDGRKRCCLSWWSGSTFTPRSPTRGLYTFVMATRRRPAPRSSTSGNSTSQAIGGRADAERDLLRQHAAFAPHLTLLERCIGRYPEILRGEFPATDAFFPGGSMETVEAIYRGSGIAEYFHGRVAESVRAAVE